MLDYREAFANYDKNGDGTIDENELMYVMRSLGENPSEDQMAYIMHEVSRLFIDHKIINEAQKKGSSYLHLQYCSNNLFHCF